jgi:hypothetical protein
VKKKKKNHIQNNNNSNNVKFVKRKGSGEVKLSQAEVEKL